jgi:hypothetical protein
MDIERQLQRYGLPVQPVQIFHLVLVSFFLPASLSRRTGTEQAKNTPDTSSISSAASLPSVAQITGVMEKAIIPMVAIISKPPYFFDFSMDVISLKANLNGCGQQLEESNRVSSEK